MRAPRPGRGMDNRQTARVLALAGGVISIVSTLFFVAVFRFFISMMDSVGPYDEGPFPFGGLELALLGIPLLLGVGAGIVLLVAAPRLRSLDEAERQRWGIVALVAGSVGLTGSAFVGGALGIGAGIVTLMDKGAAAPVAPYAPPPPPPPYR